MKICAPLVVVLLLMCGCVSIKAPENLSMGNNNTAHRRDSSRVPATRDHQHAREELAIAYDRIRHLEKKVADLKEEVEELEEDKEKLERKLDRYDD